MRVTNAVVVIVLLALIVSSVPTLAQGQTQDWRDPQSVWSKGLDIAGWAGGIGATAQGITGGIQRGWDSRSIGSTLVGVAILTGKSVMAVKGRNERKRAEAANRNDQQLAAMAAQQMELNRQQIEFSRQQLESNRQQAETNRLILEKLNQSQNQPSVDRPAAPRLPRTSNPSPEIPSPDPNAVEYTIWNQLETREGGGHLNVRMNLVRTMIRGGNTWLIVKPSESLTIYGPRNAGIRAEVYAHSEDTDQLSWQPLTLGRDLFPTGEGWVIHY